MKALIAFQLSIIIALMLVGIVTFMVQTEKLVEAYGDIPIRREWHIDHLDIANPDNIYLYKIKDKNAKEKTER